MKKKFLILSALLTVVFSAALLQSCSADDDSYTTEEYGYYTAEEIDAIKALADMYDLDVEIKLNNYGKKKPLSDFDARFQAISQIKGRYEMVPVETNSEEGHSICRKVDMPVNRTTTNALEKGSWSKSKIVSVQKTDKLNRPYYDNFDISVSIEWDLKTEEPGKRLKGSVSISDLDNTEGDLSAGFSGSESINFSGKIQGDEVDDEYNIITYKFRIRNGEVNRKTGMGDFVIE